MTEEEYKQKIQELNTLEEEHIKLTDYPLRTMRQHQKVKSDSISDWLKAGYDVRVSFTKELNDGLGNLYGDALDGDGKLIDAIQSKTSDGGASPEMVRNTLGVIAHQIYSHCFGVKELNDKSIINSDKSKVLYDELKAFKEKQKLATS